MGGMGGMGESASDTSHLLVPAVARIHHPASEGTADLVARLRAPSAEYRMDIPHVRGTRWRYR